MNCMTVQNQQQKHHYLFLKKWQQAVNESTLNVIEECTAMKTLQNYRTVEHYSDLTELREVRSWTVNCYEWMTTSHYWRVSICI